MVLSHSARFVQWTEGFNISLSARRPCAEVTETKEETRFKNTPYRKGAWQAADSRRGGGHLDRNEKRGKTVFQLLKKKYTDKRAPFCL